MLGVKPRIGDSGALKPFAQRPLGLRLIIAYKFVKAPVMLALALWLTFAPNTVFRSVGLLTRELAEGGVVWVRVGAWIQAHLTGRIIVRGAILAWLDTVVTVLEGFLLLSGKSWGEWIVILGLAALIPVEALSFGHRPGLGRVMVLVSNAAIVFYLVVRRFRHERA
jgi:hypothetical protein